MLQDVGNAPMCRGPVAVMMVVIVGGVGVFGCINFQKTVDSALLLSPDFMKDTYLV